MSKIEYTTTDVYTDGRVPQPVPPPEGNWKLLGPPLPLGPRYIFYWESIPEKTEDMSADDVLSASAKLVAAIKFGINHIIKRIEAAPNPEAAQRDAVAGLHGLLTAIDKMLQVGS